MKTEAELWKELHDRLKVGCFMCTEIDRMEFYDPSECELYAKMRMRIHEWRSVIRGSWPIVSPRPSENPGLNHFQMQYSLKLRKAFCNRMAHECEVGSV